MVASGTSYTLANILVPTTVYLQTTNSVGCSSTLTPVVITPTAVPPPTVVPGSACDIGSVQVGINPVSGITYYNWYSNAAGTTLVQSGNSLSYSQNIPVANGSYTVYVQSTMPGCSPSSLVPVSGSVSATPITLVQSVLPNDTVCINTVVSFSLNPGGGNGTFAYSWSPVTSTVSSITQTVSVSTLYSVLISSGGCSKLFYLPVIVHPAPKDSIGVPLIISCSNSTITLNGSYSEAGPNIAYSWTTSGGNILSSTTSNTILVNLAGTYNLLVTNTVTGCSSTQSVVVTGTTVPVSASITANPTTGFSPLTVNFTDVGTGAISYSWNFGNGSVISTSVNPAYTYTTGGTYTVILTASSVSCTATASIVIIVEDGLTLVIPNVFTPNDDGINDVFTITSTGIKEISLSIFNRWGLKLYEFSGPKAGWDGIITPTGAKATDGTYLFFVKATGFDDKVIEKQGTVNLFR